MIDLFEESTILEKGLGNRSKDLNATYEKALKLCEEIGVNAIEDLSSLIQSPFPLYSCKRACTSNHYLFGGSSQSLGKGETKLQSKVSCLMEAIETYYVEKIPQNLIRNSFNNLKKTFLIVNPNKIIHLSSKFQINLDSNIMWGMAYHPHLKQDVLVPAELIYFPFVAEDYLTAEGFNPSSNGLASGNNYLEAVCHGLYEIIERGVISDCDLGFGVRREVKIEDFLNEGEVLELIKTHQLKLYFLDSFNLNGVPVFEAEVCLNGKSAFGHGCDLNPIVAMKRAIFESLQSLTIYFARDREDFHLSNIQREKYFSHSVKDLVFSPRLNLSLKKFNLGASHLDFIKYNFMTLQEEYNEICKLLTASGHGDFFIADLSPKNSKLKIVKIISTSILSKTHFYHISRYKNSDRNRLISFKYNLFLSRDKV